MICPPRHHPNALVPKIAAKIGSADVIVFDVSELTLDSISVPFTAFVGQRAECRAETVRRVFVL
jgi:hypothetical protein